MFFHFSFLRLCAAITQIHIILQSLVHLWPCQEHNPQNPMEFRQGYFCFEEIYKICGDSFPWSLADISYEHRCLELWSCWSSNKYESLREIDVQVFCNSLLAFNIVDPLKYGQQTFHERGQVTNIDFVGQEAKLGMLGRHLIVFRYNSSDELWSP